MSLNLSFARRGVFLAAFLWALVSFAPDRLELFDQNGLQVPNYASLVAGLKPGITLAFKNAEFTLLERLGGDGSEEIYDIGNGKAIRLSKHERPGKWKNSFQEGYSILAEAGVAMPRVYLEESMLGEYTIVEKIHKEFNLKTFCDGATGKSEADKELIWRGLIEFAKTTAGLSEIADFKPSNIVWTGTRWLLIDWDSHHERARSSDTRTAFEVVGSIVSILPPKILQEIRREVGISRRAAAEFRAKCGPPISHLKMGK